MAQCHMKSSQSVTNKLLPLGDQKVLDMVMNEWLISLYWISIGPPILEIQLFQTLTLKIHGKDHGDGQSYLIWLWKSKVKIITKINKFYLAHSDKRHIFIHSEHFHIYSNNIIHTYQHQHQHLWLPTCYTFLYLCILRHGSHSQLSWSVPHMCVVYRPVLEYSVLP